MIRPRDLLLSAALLFSVLSTARTAFFETASEESLVTGPRKQLLFANAFEEKPAERIPSVTGEVLRREEIQERDHATSKESRQAVYEPVEPAPKTGKESATSWLICHCVDFE